jgi:hypothetical protein
MVVPVWPRCCCCRCRRGVMPLVVVVVMMVLRRRHQLQQLAFLPRPFLLLLVMVAVAHALAEEQLGAPALGGRGLCVRVCVLFVGGGGGQGRLESALIAGGGGAAQSMPPRFYIANRNPMQSKQSSPRTSPTGRSDVPIRPGGDAACRLMHLGRGRDERWPGPVCVSCAVYGRAFERSSPSIQGRRCQLKATARSFEHQQRSPRMHV